MFKILGGMDAFDQWMTGEMLTNEHMSVGDRVVFRNTCGKQRIMYAYEEGGEVYVNVPDQLLQDDKPVIVNLTGHPGCQTIFKIHPHDKPEDYAEAYTEADRHDPNDLKSVVKSLVSAGGGSGGGSAGDILVVKSWFVDDEEAHTTTFHTDKAFEEAWEANNAGKLVVVGIFGYWSTCVRAQENSDGTKTMFFASPIVGILNDPAEYPNAAFVEFKPTFKLIVWRSDGKAFDMAVSLPSSDMNTEVYETVLNVPIPW